jgi:hypothetical protein
MTKGRTTESRFLGSEYHQDRVKNYRIFSGCEYHQQVLRTEGRTTESRF